MSALHQAVDDHIGLRRSLGFKLEDYPWILHDLVGYLEAAGAATITADLPVGWALRPGQQAHPSYLGKRLSVACGFARHLAAFDPATEVPSADLLHWQECRATPYIYSDDEIAALMAAARKPQPELRAAMYETLIGPLMVTGARVGELLRLDNDDVDFDDGVLVIRYSNSTRAESCRCTRARTRRSSSTQRSVNGYARAQQRAASSRPPCSSG